MMKKATVITIILVSLSLALPVMAADDAAVLFQSKCSACHGKTGAADTPMGKSKSIKDLASNDIQKQTDDQLTDFIANGKGHGFKAKGLTDDQVKALVGFIRTLKK
jgi:mono/diheme cytochrome c family protein